MKQITLENEILKVDICPSSGGKITSFYLKGSEFELAAQSSEAQYRERCRLSVESTERSFAPYAYGMDDAFPSISGEKIEWNSRWLIYPDHGEIWDADFEVRAQAPEHVCLAWRSSLFHYFFEKKMRLEKNTLKIDYHIINEGENELPCIWTWHGLIVYEQDMEILLPDGVYHCRNVLGGGMLGKEGMVYPLQNEVYDFTKMPDPKVFNMVKYYGEEPALKGHCGVYYPSRKVFYSLDYDAEKLPYLGVWITAGGFQGDFNCALEPSNGYYDSIEKAKENQKLLVLDKGQTLDFTLELTLREGVC